MHFFQKFTFISNPINGNKIIKKYKFKVTNTLKKFIFDLNNFNVKHTNLINCVNIYTKCIKKYRVEKYSNNITFLRTSKNFVKSKFIKINPFCKNIVFMCLLINLILINELALIYYNISINYQYANLLILLILFVYSIYLYIIILLKS